MANQKVYNIVINGVKESISEVDILINQLDKLENKLNDISKNGIDIDIEPKGLKDLEKVKIPELKLENIDTKKVRQEFKQLEKDIAKGAKTLDGSYTNTLAGLRAQIRDLKDLFSRLDLDVDAEEIKKMSVVISDINDDVKKLEQSYGTYSRNVGNYTNSINEALDKQKQKTQELGNETDATLKDILDRFESIKNVDMDFNDVLDQGFSITELEKLNKHLGSLRKETKSNSEEYQDLTIQFKAAKDALNALKKEAGDYTRGEDQLSNVFKINIGEVEYTFQNVSQAIGEIDDRMHKLTANMRMLKEVGKENTEEFKNMAKELEEVTRVSAKLETDRISADMNRDMNVGNAGLNRAVVGFQALGNAMQIGSGIAGLFGQSQEEIQEAMNRTLQIMAILEAAQTLFNKQTEIGVFVHQKWASTLAASEVQLQKFGIATRNAAGQVNLLTKAVSGLKMIGWALLIVGVIDAVGKAIDLFKEWKNALSDVEKGLINAANQLTRFKNATNEWLSEIERLNQIKIDLGLIDEVEAASDVLAKLKADYTLTLGDISKVSNDFSGKWKNLLGFDTKNLENDKGKIVDVLKSLSFEYNLNKETIEKYKEAIETSSTDLDEHTIKTYNAALAQNTLYESLSRMVEGYGNYLQALENVNGSEEDNSEKILDVERKIAQDKVSAMKEGFLKEQAQRDLEQKWEIEDAKKTGIRVREQIDAINAKYNRMNLDALNKYTDEISAIVEENGDDIFGYIQDTQIKINNEIVRYSTNSLNTYIDNLKEFNPKLEREILKSENTLYGLIDGFKNTDFSIDTSSFGGFFKSIGKVLKNGYNVIKEDIRHYIAEPFRSEDLEKALDYNLNLIKYNVFGIGELFNPLIQEIETHTSITVESFKALIDVTENSLKKLEMSYKEGYTGKEQYEEEKKDLNSKLELYKGYYKDVLTNTTNSEEEIEKIEEEYFKKGINIKRLHIGEFIGVLYEQQAALQKIEEVTHQQSLDSESEWLNDRFKMLDEAEDMELQQLNLTEEDKKEISDRYAKERETTQQEYNNRIKVLTQTYLNGLVDIEQDIYHQRSQVLKEYNDAVYRQYQDHYDKLNSLVEKNSNANEVDMGSEDLSNIGDFAQFVTNSVRFKENFVKLKEDIIAEKEELQQQLKDGVITSEAFNASMENLLNLEEETDKTLASLSKSFIEYAQSYAQLGQAIVGIWAQMYSQIADLEYQNEMYRIEKLQEQYDKETEILEKALEEQTELYEKHNQNVESIEGELQTARGDRRLFLLDQINSEMMKREQAWAQQQKIAKQQEELEKKKEQLEQRQKAAEQKRNKQQQKVQIAQATASTALAVTNALAVQPWFLRSCTCCCCCCYGSCSDCYYR